MFQRTEHVARGVAKLPNRRRFSAASRVSPRNCADAAILQDPDGADLDQFVQDDPGIDVAAECAYQRSKRWIRAVDRQDKRFAFNIGEHGALKPTSQHSRQPVSTVVLFCCGVRRAVIRRVNNIADHMPVQASNCGNA